MARSPKRPTPSARLDALWPRVQLHDLYREREPDEVVDRNTVTHQLESIGELPLYELDTPDEEVRAMVRLWKRNVHPDSKRLKDTAITASYAATVFQLAMRWCGNYEAELESASKGRKEGKAITK